MSTLCEIRHVVFPTFNQVSNSSAKLSCYHCYKLFFSRFSTSYFPLSLARSFSQSSRYLSLLLLPLFLSVPLFIYLFIYFLFFFWILSLLFFLVIIILLLLLLLLLLILFLFIIIIFFFYEPTYFI